MRHSRLLGLAALLAAMVAPGCGGGDNATDSGPVDTGGNDGSINPNGLPAGSPCTANDQCGGANALCLTDGLFPLSALADSPDEGARTFAALGLPLPSGYCSTVPNCVTDADCGPGGECFFPLEFVDPEILEEGVSVLGLARQEDVDIFLSFGNYGHCLQPCTNDAACTREGYACAAPLAEFIGLVGGDTESTFCVGDIVEICDLTCENGTCAIDDNTGGAICECTTGWMGDLCNEAVPGDCDPLVANLPLSVVLSGVDANDTATYSCASGQRPDGGDVVRTCQGDGTWTGTAPTGCVNSTNVCDPNPCMNGGTCTEVSGAATCSNCNAGYSGDRCEVPVDCGTLTASTPLMVSFTSTTLNATATYACSGGDILVGAATRQCQADGTWSNSVPTCEAPPTTCADSPCMNGGACNEVGGVFDSCSCTAGWEGPTCGTRVTCPVLTPASPLTIQSLSDASNYDSVATYACNQGFQLQGQATRTCGGTGSWSGSAPTCVAITCSPLGVSAPLQVDTSSTAWGAIATFSCVEGFNLTGTPTTTTCGNEGWSPAGLPSCSIVTCPALTNPTNGTVDDGDAEFGANASYTCNEGYASAGGSARTCQANGSWSGAAPTCNPVACPNVTAPTNGAVTATSGTFGDSITYSCSMGFTLTGGMATQMCLSSGAWSSTAPTCQAVLCPTLTAPTNGTVDDGDNSVGTVASYACNSASGYVASGGSPRTCQMDGTWNGTAPTCTLRDCGAAPAADSNGTTTPPGATLVGATAMYACDSGYTGGGTLTCLPTGSWSASTAPACTIVSCGAPPAVTNGSVGSGGTTAGSTRAYTCGSGYTPSGNTTVTCQNNGSWTAPPVCNPIPNGCQGVTCQNGGTCTQDGGGTFTGCTGCNAGYSGTFCEVPVDCGGLTLTNGMVTTSMGTTLGSTATYTCNMGYNRSGSATRTCQSNGNWSNTAATCVIVDCGAPSTNPNSTVMTTSTQYNGTATYSCNAASGYVQTGGNATRTCGAGGTWSGSAITCGLASCGAPPAPTGGVTVNTTMQTYGGTATYSCPTGQAPAGGVAVRTCGLNGTTPEWTPGAMLTCAPVSCAGSDPGVGTNATRMVNGTNYNDTIVYSCNNGYSGAAMERMRTITCQANGTWTAAQLDCTPMSCGAPPAAPTNSTLGGSGTTFGSTRPYTCDTGYNGTAGSQSCTWGGSSVSWTGTLPTCTPVMCSPTMPSNGMVSGGTTYNTTATYSCTSGYTLVGNMTRTCQANGTLSGSQPSCTPVSCGAAPGETGGTALTTGIGLSGGSGTTFGSSRMYNCITGWQPGTTYTQTCGAAGTWGGDALNQCTRNMCPTLNAPMNGSVTSGGAGSFGDSVTFSCGSGYNINGSGSLMCQANGMWNGSAPTCTASSSCSPNPCGTGTCTDTGGGAFTCACPLGFAGTTCTIPVCEITYQPNDLRFAVTNTPLSGAGDRTLVATPPYPQPVNNTAEFPNIGGGSFVIRVHTNGAGAIVNGPIQFRQYALDMNFNVRTDLGFLGSGTVYSRLDATAGTSNRAAAAAATGTVSGTTITWSTPLAGYRTVGPVRCTGSGLVCNNAGTPLDQDTTTPLPNSGLASVPVGTAWPAWTLSNNGASGTVMTATGTSVGTSPPAGGGWAVTSEGSSPSQRTFLRIRGVEVSRVCGASLN
jgi:hypothetical protein